MEKWEIRAVLHYYKSLELKISDLKFDQKEWTNFSNLLITDKSKALKMLKSKYTEVNHAHFGTSSIPKLMGTFLMLKMGSIFLKVDVYIVMMPKQGSPISK